MIAKLAEYRKAIAALAPLVILVISTEVGADSKWVAYALAAFAAVGVVVVPNRPPAA